MSFNEIAEFRELLSRISKDQPKLITAGMRSLLWAIISQSDGCFIGRFELADQAGLSPETVKTYLRRLTPLNVILREQTYVRRGIRQCYRVSLPGLRELVRVSPVTPIEVDSSLLGITESVSGITESATGYHQSPTYRDKRNYKDERVTTNLSTLNLTRFQEVVLSPLPSHVREFVTPGSNMEKILDELQLLGALDDAPGRLKEVNYDPGKNPGGLVLKVLNDLLSLTKQRIERDQLERERDQKVVRDLEEAERNKSSDPDIWIEVARKKLAKAKDSPTTF
jgi:DNA-binding Lrp family transcriptional regulator